MHMHQPGTIYQHSGKFSPIALFIPILITACAAALAFGYAYLDVHVPLFGKLKFIIAILAALGLGFVANLSLNLFKVRNVALCWITGLLSGIVLLYLSWATFIYLLINYDATESPARVPFLNLLLNPVGLWHVIARVNETGWFSLSRSGWTPSGWFLGIMWALEAVMFLLIPLFMASVAIKDKVFCESCNSWNDAKTGLLNLNLLSVSSVLESFMKSPDPALLAKLPRSTVQDTQFCRVDASTCQKCQSFHTLSLKQVTRGVDTEGDTKFDVANLTPEVIVESSFLNGLKADAHLS